jgi:hypothetical protein
MKNKPKKKTGRPMFKIDWDQVDSMCQIFCTEVEIASILGCSIETLRRACEREKGCRFVEYYAQKSDGGRRSLRRKQYTLAENGDRVMLIWLGKQVLGQSEKSKVETNNTTRVEEHVRIYLPDNGRGKDGK